MKKKTNQGFLTLQFPFFPAVSVWKLCLVTGCAALALLCRPRELIGQEITLQQAVELSQKQGYSARAAGATPEAGPRPDPPRGAAPRPPPPLRWPSTGSRFRASARA